MSSNPIQKTNYWQRYLPFLDWLLHYRRQDWVGDVMAGIIVAIMLVPQGMAYSMLAGLPPQAGLYASIVPLILYALLGSSRTLAVGPVALVSLMVASGIGLLAPRDMSQYIALALVLALLVGLIQLAMGVVRLGFLVNFLSNAVISGFTSAAAVLIAFGQLKHLTGIGVPAGETLWGSLGYLGQNLADTSPATLGLGLGSLSLLVYFKGPLKRQLQRWGIGENKIVPLTRSGPLLVVVVGALLVWGLALDETAGVKIVGQIPLGLPPLTWPSFDWGLFKALLPTALAISFIGFMSSVAVAKSLASKRRQKVDPNQELIALGTANLGAAFTGGFPVTGGFGRSVVNFSAGANTGLASLITAGLIALTALLITHLFYFLPRAVLAAIIMEAVLGLIDWPKARYMWRYSRADGASLCITFVAMLAAGIEAGIIVGSLSTIVLFLWRTSKPHMTIVGRVEDSEQFRSVGHHKVKTYPNILIFRIDENLYFTNTSHIEERLINEIVARPEIRHLVLIASGINFIDASALETLEKLVEELREGGVVLHLSEVKEPVLERLERVGFAEKMGEGRIFLSADEAIRVLNKPTKAAYHI